MKTTRILAISVLVLVLGLPVGIAKADFTFGTPTLFDEPVNSTGIECFNCISADGLEIYIEKPVSGGINSLDWDIYVSARATTNDPWPVPVSLGPVVNSSDNEGSASLSGDGLELYFGSWGLGGHGASDLWVTTRPTRSDPWAPAENLGPTVNSSDSDNLPSITADGLELYFSSDRPGGYGSVDIWVARRTTTNDPWGEPMNLGSAVNSTRGEFFPCLAPGGLVLFLSDYDNSMYGFLPGGYGLSDMWMTKRKSATDPWELPVNLGSGMNTDAWDSVPRVSPDGSVLYFTSSRPENTALTPKSDIWQVPIIPIADFNGDGIVDSVDMCIMVDHWHTDEPSCDIGPMPWGDGIVDVQDLKVLAEHLFTYPGAVAYWKLDETEGNTAHDSIGDNDGTVNGEPNWQPEGGIVNGALLLDGVDDYVLTEYVRDPSEGPLSMFAWVKDGAPGQVLVSQVLGANWLMTDSSSGHLMTDLKGSGRDARPLLSEVRITDGNWHRVGLVWDGANRILYVDDVVAATDTQTELTGSNGGLNIGCGKNLGSGSFWSGLVDDVFIYNRAVKP